MCSDTRYSFRPAVGFILSWFIEVGPGLLIKATDFEISYEGNLKCIKAPKHSQGWLKCLNMPVTKMTVMKAVLMLMMMFIFNIVLLLKSTVWPLLIYTTLHLWRHLGTQFSSRQITVAELSPFPAETKPEMLMLPATGMRPTWQHPWHLQHDFSRGISML